jgi:hypothetical protein
VPFGFTVAARDKSPASGFQAFGVRATAPASRGGIATQRGTQKIRDHAPKDGELHRIADALQAIQRRNFYQLHATVTHRDRYYHEYCMAISVERDSPAYQDMTADAEEAVIEALRDLARWLYRQLEQDYEGQTSDESVDEAIAANEYTFTESGHRFG